MAGLIATLVAVAVATAGSARPFGHPSPGKAYPERENFTLWLVEEFDGPLDLDTDLVWTWSDGALPEGAVRFVREGIKFEDGRLVLEARKAEPVSQPDFCSHAEASWVGDKPMTSGEMRSRHNMFRYGYYEASMRTPRTRPQNRTANGSYVSSFVVYRDATFRQWREIDIELSGDVSSSVTARVLHAEGSASGGPDVDSHLSCSAEGRDLRDEFHTYALEWLPTGITWYLDGEPIAHHGSGEQPPVPELSGKVMMNLWLLDGGVPSGVAEASGDECPLRSEYDWFRFYRWDGEEVYPCAGFSDHCLAEEDVLFSGNNPCDGLPRRPVGPGETPCAAACLSEVSDVSRAPTAMSPSAASSDVAGPPRHDEGPAAAAHLADASMDMWGTAPLGVQGSVVKGFLRGAAGGKPLFR